MPIATFKAVREVSSEDAVHSAQNLLKQQPGKKWKTKIVGEKSAFVILELEKEEQITGIDIGNEHSAFVEVLVGKAGCSGDGFTEILLTCSFMTPIESKNSTNPNRVRCFNEEALVSTAASGKWLLVKIICTQPFNKHVQYGLSFLKLHVVANKETAVKSLVPERFLQRKSTDSNESVEGVKPTLSAFHIGKFALREDSPDSESEGTTSLFNRWKMSQNSTGKANALTSAAAIREASSPAALRRLSDQRDQSFQKATLSVKTLSPANVRESVNENKEKVLDRNRESLLFGNDDDDDAGGSSNALKNQRLAKQIEADKERVRLEKEKLTTQKRKPVESSPRPGKTAYKANDSTSSQQTKDVDVQRSSKKRHSSPISRPAKKVELSQVQYRPFNQLLRGVVLVISGIQNPDRADLRSKALAMGAKYKTDWEPGCTHLICAFKNTPKYNQVKGKGKIVTRSWIEKCYSLKKYLPWRRYALDSAEVGQPESDEEILCETLKPKVMELDDDDNADELPTTSHSNAADKSKTAMRDEGEPDDNTKEIHNISSGSDTEDEIERIAKKNKEKNSLNGSADMPVASEKPKSNKADVYEATTEEEDYLKEINLKTNMKSTSEGIFKKCKFYICNDIGDIDKIKLTHFIDKYAGHLTEVLSEAHYAISKEALRKPEADNFTGETVTPLWVYECNDMESKVPTMRYLV